MTPEEIVSMISRQAFYESAKIRKPRDEGLYVSKVVSAISKFERASMRLANADQRPARAQGYREESAMLAIDAAVQAVLSAIHHPNAGDLDVEDGAEILH